MHSMHLNKERLLVCVVFAFLCSADSTVQAQTITEIEVSLEYTGEVWRNWQGGVSKGEQYLDHISADFSAKNPFWGELYLQGIRTNSAVLSEKFIGDIQVVSNIDAEETLRPYQAWLQKKFLNDRLSLLAGLYDLNSEFDVVETAGLFLNSSHGIGVDISQSGYGGPSIFPDTDLAVRMSYSVSENALLRAAWVDTKDAEANSDLLIGELSHGFGNEVNLNVGVWAYTNKFASLSGSTEKHAYGLYVSYEGAISRSGDLRAFARVGWANPQPHLIGRYMGFGLVKENPFGFKPRDHIGFAIATAWRSTEADAASLGHSSVARQEIALELTYQLALNDWLTVQPDAQYIIKPGLDPGLQDVFVTGLRFTVTAPF